MSVQELLMNPAKRYRARVAISGSAQTQALGADYYNFAVWPDVGASACYVAVNAKGTTTAAANTDPLIDNAMGREYHLSTPVNIVYWLGVGNTGYINIEAW